MAHEGSAWAEPRANSSFALRSSGVLLRAAGHAFLSATNRKSPIANRNLDAEGVRFELTTHRSGFGGHFSLVNGV